MSLLSALSIMHKKLLDFLVINNGFRNNHSTAHALTGLTEKVELITDDGNYGCGVVIDLKKVFDTLNHQNRKEGS